MAKKAVGKAVGKKATKKNKSSILDDLISESANKHATTGDDIKNITRWFDTGSYVLNGIVSGCMFKGYPAGRTTALAGEETTGKTFFALTAVEIFLNENPDGICIFFKSENAITKDMLIERGIDIDRIAFLPIFSVEGFRNQIIRILLKYTKTAKSKRVPMFCVLDSLGQLPTEKEIADVNKDKINADMGSRAKAVKSAFRVIEGNLEFADVPLIMTNHTYNSMGLFPTQEVAGGGGLKYSASIIVLLGKKQDKTSTGTHLGKRIPCKINKSRFTREHSRVEVGIKFDSGLQRYDGLLDLALLGEIWSKVDTKINIGDDEKGEPILLTPKAINSKPEEYFNMEMLNKLNEVVKEYFCFGSTKNLDEVEKENDEELIELNNE